jgi:hydroxymethylpyrimidine pyrophosphatase-like HAD family hydrolase
MTLNFYPDEQGVYTDREKVRRFLLDYPSVDFVSGGYNNLEITRAGTNKGIGLHRLAEILGVDPAGTMAIGDSENDLAILKAAGIGVAMGNATDALKAQADYITASNEEDGVACAIERFT